MLQYLSNGKRLTENVSRQLLNFWVAKSNEDVNSVPVHCAL